MKTLISRARGFTLIELLIVIAIIAILTGIIITNLAGSRAKSRDGAAVSDISQIQLALEQYFDRCQQYPVLPNMQNNNGTISGVISGLSASTLAGINNSGACPSLGTFINHTPNSANSWTYDYYINNSSDPTDYILHARLETNAAALNDSILQSGKPGWAQNTGTTCYTPASSGPYDYCIGSK